MRTNQTNNYQVVYQATSVKNAVLIYDVKDKIYSLVHYDTEILRVDENNNIQKALKCSNSSSRAIFQVAEYLGLDKNEVKRSMVEFYDFHKYDAGSRK